MAVSLGREAIAERPELAAWPGAREPGWEAGGALPRESLAHVPVAGSFVLYYFEGVIHT